MIRPVAHPTLAAVPSIVPSITAPSPPFQNSRPSAFAGLTKIAS